MKRCMLVQSRITKDENTKENLLFMTLVKMPSPMNNGGLYYPSKNDLFVYVCVNENKTPKEYLDMQKVYPGALFDITFGVNDFNGKKFVARFDLVPGSNKHIYEDVYVK